MTFNDIKRMEEIILVKKDDGELQRIEEIEDEIELIERTLESYDDVRKLMDDEIKRLFDELDSLDDTEMEMYERLRKLKEALAMYVVR